MATGLHPPGYQSDLEYVWGLVQQLSETLAENRATTSRIIANVETLHNSAIESGAQDPELQKIDEGLHGKLLVVIMRVTAITADFTANNAVEIARLHQKIAKLTEERDAARRDARENWNLVEHMMANLENIAEKVRPYAANMHTNLLEWHNYYANLLQKERDDNLAMRLDNDARMASLGRLSHWVSLLRNGLVDGDLSAIGQITYLKGQVRAFRRLAGFEPDPEMAEDET